MLPLAPFDSRTQTSDCRCETVCLLLKTIRCSVRSLPNPPHSMPCSMQSFAVIEKTIGCSVRSLPRSMQTFCVIAQNNTCSPHIKENTSATLSPTLPSFSFPAKFTFIRDHSDERSLLCYFHRAISKSAKLITRKPERENSLLDPNIVFTRI